MKNKTKNTAAVSIFGPATATSANGDESRANSKVTSTVDIKVTVAGLISQGKELSGDSSLDNSSGKLSSFLALGQELLKDRPELAKGFEQATTVGGAYGIIDYRNPEPGTKRSQEASHNQAIAKIKRGIEFLESLACVFGV
jgi:hypothetical protein